MYQLIFSLTFIVLATIFAALGFLAGKKNKWQLSASKILFTVVSAVLSAVLAAVTAQLAANVAFNAAMDMFPAIAEDAALLPVSTELVKALAGTVLSPVLFLPIFALLRLLFGLAVAPVARLMTGDKIDKQAIENGEISKKAAKKALVKNPRITVASSLCGALTGLVLFTVIAIPTVFGLSGAGEIVAAVTEGNNSNDTVITVNQVSKGLASNAATVTLKLTGGKLIYDSMTTASAGNTVISLDNEKEFAVALTKAVKEFMKDKESYDGAKAQEQFIQSAATFKNTELLPNALPEAVTVACNKWDNGETFFGLEDLREKNPTFKPAISAAVNVFNGSTPETAKNDMADILTAAGVLSLNYRFEYIKSAPFDILKNQETTEQVLKVFLGNPRLNALVIGVTQSGLNMLTAKMNMTTTLEGMYDSMTAELTAEISAFITEEMISEIPDDYLPPLENLSLKLNAGTENTEEPEENVTEDEAKEETEEEPEEDTTSELVKKLAKRLSRVFGNYGVKLTDASVTEIAERIIAEFTDTQPKDVTADGVTTILSTTTVTVVKADGTEKPLELASQEAFEESTQIVLITTITLNQTQASDVEKEAKALSEGLMHISTMYTNISDGGFDAKTVVKDMGPVLDALSQTEMIGEDNTKTLMVGVLQSDTAREAVKMPIVEITEVANQICDLSKEENYSTLMGTLSTTIEVVENAKDGGDTTASVNELIDNLTPASAKTIQTLAKPSLIQSYGVSEKYAEPTADLVSKLFGNLSEAKQEDQLTDEQYKVEADAIADMMKIALNTNKENKRTFGEDSKTGLTATEFVSRIVSSQVVSKTAVESVYGEGDTPTVNPLGAASKLSEEERAELLAALNAEYANTPEDNRAEKAKVLISAASIINMEVVVTDGVLVEIVEIVESVPEAPAE